MHSTRSPGCVSLSGLRLIIIAFQGYSTSFFCLCSNFLHSAAPLISCSSSLLYSDLFSIPSSPFSQFICVFISNLVFFYSVRLTLTSILSTSVLFIVPCLYNLLQAITKPFRDFLEANASPWFSVREKFR